MHNIKNRGTKHNQIIYISSPTIIIFLLTFICFFSCFAANISFSATYYVSKNGNVANDGTTWALALLSIKTALSKAVSGDNVWVAEGTYIEGETIEVKPGVSVYGGFAGNETSINDRNISQNKTIIDGNNSYQCVKNSGTIDGFHVTKGKNYSGGGVFGGGIYSYYGSITNCNIYFNSATNSGGGIYSCYGSITNCNIYSNSASFYGGGIYSYSGSSILNCTVYSNSSKSFGSGIYNRSSSIINSIIWNNKGDANVYLYDSSSIISYSCFEESVGTNGNIKMNPLFVNASGDLSTWDFHLQNGSMCIDSGTTEAKVINDIEGNPRPGGDSKIDMGAYESPDEYQPVDFPPLKRIYVSKTGDNTTGLSWNTAYNTIKKALECIDDNSYEIWVAKGNYIEGETIINPGRSALIGCFAGNEISINDRDISKNKTIIDGNNSYQCVKNSGTIDGFHVTKGKTYNGGGIYCCSGSITNCTTYSNSAYYNGGGIYSDSGSITNCAVYSNSASDVGGGIYCYSGSSITNCIVYSNSASDVGGGIHSSNGSITNCTVYSNSASDVGGGIYDYGSLITNCTVYSNSSKNNGSGIYNNKSTITNSIIWNNKGSVNVYLYDPSSIISYSCFEESAGKDGNIKADPMFLNTSGDMSTWNFHLQPESPCIDTGTTVSLMQDINGIPRPQWKGWDMGAYEYFNAQTGDINLDGKINDFDTRILNDYLIAKILLYAQQVQIADINKDGKIDVSDIIALINIINIP